MHSARPSLPTEMCTTCHSVGKAASRPPAMIVLRYTPEGMGEEAKPIVMVGKGIVYDTGGLSIKSTLPATLRPCTPAPSTVPSPRLKHHPHPHPPSLPFCFLVIAAPPSESSTHYIDLPQSSAHCPTGKTGMPGMKGDMGGSAAVLGAFRAAVELKVSTPLVAILCVGTTSTHSHHTPS